MRNNIFTSAGAACRLLTFIFLTTLALQTSAQIVVDDCNTGTFLQQGNGSQNVAAAGAIGGSRDVSISNAGASSYIAHFVNTGYIRVNPYYNGVNPTGNLDIGWGNSYVSGGTDLNLNAADYSRIELRLTAAPFNTGQIAVRFNKPGDPDYSSVSVNILGQSPLTYTFQLSDFSGLNPADIDGISIGFINCDPDSSSQIDYIQFSGFADADGDGIGNGSDNCPNTPNANQLDSDGDGIGNVCDACPNDPDNDVDGDGVCGNLDNCPAIANPNQLDTDGDGQGNACDTDDDNDGVADATDNCPLISNSNQLDTDGDSQGDVCDTDDDNDGIADANDNCPLISNSNQLDTDGDGLGNACDNDDDNDGVADASDNCPLISNPNQLNTDGDSQGDVCDTDDDNDGVADATDNCPLISNSNQLDTDGDGQGNVCDTDDDNDGVADATDNCPLIANANQLDTDGDGQGNVCDTDDDNDGIADATDNCPLIANSNQLDNDGDGLGNACDPCPFALPEIANFNVSTCGCLPGFTAATQLIGGVTIIVGCNAVVAADSDCDGVSNTLDKCAGGNDAVDNNNDGLADCKYPPAYNQIISAWKCGSNKVYVCHSGNTICINKNDLANHIAHGDFLGPCGNVSCDNDCDGVVNSLDKCAGGNDAVDNNNDGLADCKYPPAYNKIKSSWKCGNNKVYICHSGNTMCITYSNLASHMAHGDYLGPCGNASCNDDDDDDDFNGDRSSSIETSNATLFPNPATGEVWLDLSGYESSVFTVRIQDVRGVLVQSVHVADAAHSEPLRLDLSAVAAGMYYIQVQPEGGQMETLKLVVEDRK